MSENNDHLGDSDPGSSSEQEGGPGSGEPNISTEQEISEEETEDRWSGRRNSSDQMDGPESVALGNSTEKEVAQLGGVETYSKPMSRESDLSEEKTEDRGIGRRNSSDQMDGPESGELSNSTEKEVAQLGGVETHPTSRSGDIDLWDQEREDGQKDPEIITQSRIDVESNRETHPTSRSGDIDLWDQEREDGQKDPEIITQSRIDVESNRETHPTSRSGDTDLWDQGHEDGRKDPEIITQSRIDVESNRESPNPSPSIPEDEDSPMTNLAFDKEPTAPFSHHEDDVESQSKLEEDREDQNMDGSEVMKPSSDLMDVDEDVVAKMNVVLKESLNLADDLERGDPDIGMELNDMLLADLEVPVRPSPPPELRRSSRNAVAKNKPIMENLRSPIRGKRKPVFKKTATHFQAGDYITEFNKS